MRILDIFRPIDPNKKMMIEQELEREKLRFRESSQNAAATVRNQVLSARWFNEHPMESAALILMGGYFVARWVTRREELLNSERRVS